MVQSNYKVGINYGRSREFLELTFISWSLNHRSTFTEVDHASILVCELENSPFFHLRGENEGFRPRFPEFLHQKTFQSSNILSASNR